MNQIRWVLLAAVVAFFVFRNTGGGPKVGEPAPAVLGVQLDGQTFDLGQHQHQVVLLDFWATWCPPCQRSLPALQEIHERFRNDPRVLIASVNTDYPQNIQQVRNLMTNRKYTFPVVLDGSGGPVAQAYRVQSIPTMVVVAPGGKVHQVKVGLPANDTPGITSYLDRVINEALAKGL